MSHAADQPKPQDLLRKLPAVDHLLNQPAIARLLDDHPRSEVLTVVREVLDARRAAVRAGASVEIDLPALALDIRERLYRRGLPSLRRVINATGIPLHTGLGRAPLCAEALEAISDVARGYCTLEIDLATGRRGSRHEHVRALLRELTGAQDALVVNNNAAATYLVLNTLAAEREAVISRGQLVEIGGSYRLPDILAAANCRLVEVGTTNRTRITDYERAISEETGLLLRVHCSNYRIVGFTESATLTELVDLARRHHLLVVDDLGSGLLSGDLQWPEPETGSDGNEEAETEYAPGPAEWDEPNVRQSVADGADLSLFSGDKLLGGPQAGIIVGRADLVAALRRNPLARAFRPGKLTLAALEATLRVYRDPDAVVKRLPGLRLLARQPAELVEAAEALADAIASLPIDAEVAHEPDASEAGGGALAALPFPTWVVTVHPVEVAADKVAAALRQRAVPVICRVQDGALVFDVRTLEADDMEEVSAALAEVMRELDEE